ncbi:hypothetical protein [Chryseobacterium scophthalmum]|uniref:hypothetical protein n=1 Tax=Chryseobacterium scophthalmum TaxID=59733 RepID=UPI001AEBA6E6|nr:hypothetical protein [Chryseobacterium scophthalmum]
MKQYFKDYTEHLSAIILLFYILGFSYQFWYYQYFGIEIQYYITLTDVIFQSIGNILLSVFIFCTIEVFLLFISDFLCTSFSRWKTKFKYDTLSLESRKRADRYLKYLADSNRKYYTFTVVIIALIAGVFIFDEKLYFFSIIFPNFIYRTYRVLPKIDQESDKILKIGVSIFLFCMLIASYSYWGINDASKIAENYSSKIIKTDKIYTGNNNYKFVGETSLYLFILNKNNNVITVINKSSVDEMNIEPNKYQIEEINKYFNDIEGFAKRLRAKKNN